MPFRVCIAVLVWFRRPETRERERERNKNNYELFPNPDCFLLCPLHFENEVVVAVTIQRLDSLSRIFTTTVTHKCKPLQGIIVITLILLLLGRLANLGVLSDLVFGEKDSFDVSKV